MITVSITQGRILILQEVHEDDEKAMANFMAEKPQDRRTLAEIIMERINEKKTELQSHVSGILLTYYYSHESYKLYVSTALI